jgi:hypothetical protein
MTKIDGFAYHAKWMRRAIERYRQNKGTPWAAWARKDVYHHGKMKRMYQ